MYGKASLATVYSYSNSAQYCNQQRFGDWPANDAGLKIYDICKYPCNWVGGERLSYHEATQLNIFFSRFTELATTRV